LPAIVRHDTLAEYPRWPRRGTEVRCDTCRMGKRDRIASRTRARQNTWPLPEAPRLHGVN